MMTNETLPYSWRIVRFDEIAKRIERKIILDDSATYKTVGVRWYGMGTFVRDELLGMNINRKQQWIIKTGDVVYNKLFAWKNSFAIADDSVDGCIVSDKFPTYRADLSLVDLKFLGYYFRMPKIGQQAQDLSKGAAAISKLTLNPPQFWDLTIPLPPLDEQHRIVARIEALAVKIEEARGLRQLATSEVNLFQNRIMDSLIQATTSKRKPLESFLSEPLRNGLSLPSARMGYETGIVFAKVGAVNSGRFDPNETKMVDIDLDPSAPYWLKPDDVLVSRGNTPELVGRAAVYEGNPPTCAMPDLLIRVRLNSKLAEPRFVAAFFHSREARDYIEAQVTGTSPTMKKISQPKLNVMPMPDLVVEEQRRIMAYLDVLQAKVDALKQLQSQTQMELDALLPSVLDKAFKGEL